MPTLSEIFLDSRIPLFEAAKYDEMFGDIKRFLGKLPPYVEEQIRNARSVLKKNDRVVWYLRLWKIGLVLHMEKTGKAEGQLPEGYAEKLVADYAKKARISPREAEVHATTVFQTNVLVTLEHFLSLPIHAIQTFTFAFQGPDEIIDTFTELEQDWQKDGDRAFREDDDVEIIIKFPDGFAWVNTNRASCSKEAEAMGHCGNSPRWNTDDKIISLRKLVNRNGVTLHAPHLTFILDGDGFLGEMKGYGNAKPAEKYHKYIVPLLLHPIVQGIKGGGYRPENNFSIFDLPPRAREELIEKKPALAGIAELYRLEGLTPRVKELVLNRLRDMGISTYTIKFGEHTTVLDTFRDLLRFVQTIGDDIVESLLNYYDNGPDVETLTRDDVIEIILSFNEYDYEEFMRMHGLRAISRGTEEFRRKSSSIADYVIKGPYFDSLVAAAVEGDGENASHREKIKKLINAYIDVGWTFTGLWQYASVNEENYDAPVDICVGTADLIYALGDDDPDNEYYVLIDQAQFNGDWITVDWGALDDLRREAGLPTNSIDLTKHPAIKAFTGKEAIDYVGVGRRFLKNVKKNAISPDQLSFPFDD